MLARQIFTFHMNKASQAFYSFCYITQTPLEGGQIILKTKETVNWSESVPKKPAEEKGEE